MTAKLYNVQQPALPDGIKLSPDDGYFLVRLHDSQAFLGGWRWGKAGTLLLKTLVKSEIHDQIFAGLHKIEHFDRNKATRLRAQINLTDWLPAYGGESLHLELQYILVQNEPLKQLLDKMAKVDLSAKLTAVKWEVGMGVKVAELLGRVFSHLLEEGQAAPIFDLQADLNIDKYQAGFWAAVDTDRGPGSSPVDFALNSREDLELKNRFGHLLEEVSYALLEIVPRKRLGEHKWRETAWGQILQEGYEEALRFQTATDDRKQDAYNKFIVETCYYARKLAAADRRFVRREVDEIVAKLVGDLKEKFFGQQGYALAGDRSLPPSWQPALGVETEAELESLAEDYRQAMVDSQAWLAFYGIEEN